MSDDSIRAQYERHGVRGYYLRHGAAYRNPHEAAVRRILAAAVLEWKVDLSRVLDLACGSGEATLALLELGCPRVEGIDPFTADAYRARTGRGAERLTFEQIAAGALSGRRYSLIVCSFAMHLVERSRLPALAFELSRAAPQMLIVTPHKRPKIEEAWGWTLKGELVVERVRARLYGSRDG